MHVHVKFAFAFASAGRGSGKSTDAGTEAGVFACVVLYVRTVAGADKSAFALKGAYG